MWIVYRWTDTRPEKIGGAFDTYEEALTFAEKSKNQGYATKIEQTVGEAVL